MEKEGTDATTTTTRAPTAPVTKSVVSVAPTTVPTTVPTTANSPHTEHLQHTTQTCQPKRAFNQKGNIEALKNNQEGTPVPSVQGLVHPQQQTEQTTTESCIGTGSSVLESEEFIDNCPNKQQQSSGSINSVKSAESVKSTSTAETLIAPGTTTVVSDAHSTVPTTVNLPDAAQFQKKTQTSETKKVFHPGGNIEGQGSTTDGRLSDRVIH